MALTLAGVESAIESLIEGAQTASLDGMTVTKASLPALWEMRKGLKAEGDRSARPTLRAFNIGTMGYGQSDTDTTPTPVVPS